MNEKEMVTSFVRNVMNWYSCNDYGFFSTSSERTGRLIKRPLFIHKDIDKDTLQRLSVFLGMSEKEILEMDQSAARKYWDKYPFFRYYQKYRMIWGKRTRNLIKRRSIKDPMTAHQANTLLKNILGIEHYIKEEENEEVRYDYDFIRSRVRDQLKEIDKIIPGTYHTGATIRNLQINTEVFLSFPDCPKMLRSFLDMVDRLKELFFQTLNGDLNEDEQKEMNFLASWLGATDTAASTKTLTYQYTKAEKEVFNEEKHEDFFMYARIHGFYYTQPWRCKEFFDDMDLVKKLAIVFPSIKYEMREFAMNVSSFSCVFRWSDAKPISLSPEEMADWEFNCEEGESLPLEKIHLYVSKNEDELYDWKPYVEKLKVAASPVKQGGIPIPDRHTTSAMVNWQRLIKRITANRGGEQ